MRVAHSSLSLLRAGAFPKRCTVFHVLCYGRQEGMRCALTVAPGRSHAYPRFVFNRYDRVASPWLASALPAQSQALSRGFVLIIRTLSAPALARVGSF